MPNNTTRIRQPTDSNQGNERKRGTAQPGEAGQLLTGGSSASRRFLDTFCGDRLVDGVSAAISPAALTPAFLSFGPGWLSPGESTKLPRRVSKTWQSAQYFARMNGRDATDESASPAPCINSCCTLRTKKLPKSSTPEFCNSCHPTKIDFMEIEQEILPHIRGESQVLVLGNG